MTSSRNAPPIGDIAYFSIIAILGIYFTYASVQGDYGLFRRVQVEAEARVLEAELALIEAEVADLDNKTRRLSDAYLDLDLLDERVRDILGYVRADEIVLR
ncbi:FtsB family cell division protein [Profundibacterium mesophilum]|uniref:Septum formation initiator domain containing protein n=1 Tax=Profundibacterium mesophilum KAUST100406-0324 TaxID=1037889 RepID=A0A921TGG9_9RHOB|nr:septum formation initiator family protein [Profundibacterium mesophilum]KAF0677429.1 Septum formation initiator domain containing protein [Profundibacterium mesophilum KAUST100406-0324]